MTREELRDYVEEQRSLNNIPYYVYSTLIDGIDTLEQEPSNKNDLALLEKTYADFCNCEGGEGWLKIWQRVCYRCCI